MGLSFDVAVFLFLTKLCSWRPPRRRPKGMLRKGWRLERGKGRANNCECSF